MMTSLASIVIIKASSIMSSAIYCEVLFESKLFVPICKIKVSSWVSHNLACPGPLHQESTSCKLCGRGNQGSSSKKELQIFNHVNIPIQNLLSRARGGTALIQNLLCNLITFAQNLLR